MKELLLIVLLGMMLSCQKKVNSIQVQEEVFMEEEEYAKEFVKKAKKSRGLLLPRIAPLIKDKQAAIAVAEAVLFQVYGKDHIIWQRPYQVHQVDHYWVLSGTLPKGALGGVFEIALDGKDARVVGLTHGK